MLLSQEGHIIPILPPQDYDTGVSSDIFSMKDCSHVTIIVTFGTTNSDAGNITVNESDDLSGSNTDAIGFKYAAETTDSGDSLGALTTVAYADADSGIDVSANDNTTYVIELDAEDLSEGYNNVFISISDPGGSGYASAIAILTGLRYAGDQNRTQIA